MSWRDHGRRRLDVRRGCVKKVARACAQVPQGPRTHVLVSRRLRATSARPACAATIGLGRGRGTCKQVDCVGANVRQARLSLSARRQSHPAAQGRGRHTRVAGRTGLLACSPHDQATEWGCEACGLEQEAPSRVRHLRDCRRAASSMAFLPEPHRRRRHRAAYRACSPTAAMAVQLVGRRGREPDRRPRRQRALPIHTATVDRRAGRGHNARRARRPARCRSSSSPSLSGLCLTPWLRVEAEVRWSATRGIRAAQALDRVGPLVRRAPTFSVDGFPVGGRGPALPCGSTIRCSRGLDLQKKLRASP